MTITEYPTTTRTFFPLKLSTLNNIKSVSLRKPCKIQKYVHMQGCPIFMIFGGLEDLCTSIQNLLYFLSEIQYGRHTERHLDIQFLTLKAMENTRKLIDFTSLYFY